MNRRAVAIILDGLRRDFVRPDATPNLWRLRERATWFAAHRSTVPSVTRVCSATFATGCFPWRHGLEGNTLALLENQHFVIHDAGSPDFLVHHRRLTGRSLCEPTLAERLGNSGGAVIFSNVSPGAAYAHDPDGHGHVFHRAGSFAPGRIPVPTPEALHVGEDLAGDRAMTERFVTALTSQRHQLSVLWLGHPDTTQHAVPLGSTEHLEALREADRNAGIVFAAVEQMRAAGDDVLLLVGSDHGHQTVHQVVDVESELRGLGFSGAIASGDVVVVPNGTAVLIYARPTAQERVGAIAQALTSQEWVGRVLTFETLPCVGQTPDRGLSLIISMAEDDLPNEHGVPGRSFAAKPLASKPDRLGCGQHGGLGYYEQAPFLLAEGAGFPAGSTWNRQTSLVDLAPTILTHLSFPVGDLDGRRLQMDGSFQ